jgi:hypothetical protein
MTVCNSTACSASFASCWTAELHVVQIIAYRPDCYFLLCDMLHDARAG